MRKLFSQVMLVSMCFCFVGCGYTTRASLPARLRTVHVQTFKNNIDFTSESFSNVYLPLLEVDVTNAIVDRFLFDGNLKIAQEQVADLVLNGTLTGYQREALRYTDNDDVQEYRVQVIVDLVLYDTGKDETLWTESGFVGEATYFLTGVQATTEASAVSEATVDLARRVIERTIENW
ncbi:MAG: hypothetical protein KAJ18_05055 [Candidatus Omnitrophica bacterium]|nr:hypothetical protein [Candidatus Omnitrophota bacterium]